MKMPCLCIQQVQAPPPPGQRAQGKKEKKHERFWFEGWTAPGKLGKVNTICVGETLKLNTNMRINVV